LHTSKCITTSSARNDTSENNNFSVTKKKIILITIDIKLVRSGLFLISNLNDTYLVKEAV
jgi:hypothetical protein